MLERPLISIVVPVFNSEKYIEECVHSIQHQTYDCFEVILVDDGSQDGSQDILKKAVKLDSRVKLITQSNKGTSAARNEALNHCSGDYITFIDSDDLISSDYLEILLSLALENGADIVFSKHTRNLKSLGLNNQTFKTLEAKTFLSKILYKQVSYNVVGGALFKKRVWDGVRFYPHYYEDLEIFPRLIDNATTIVTTSARLYYYRPVNTGNTGNISAKRFDVLQATESIIAFLRAKQMTSLLPAARSRKLSASFNVHIITASCAEYQDIHEQTWSTILELRKESLLDTKVICKIKLGIILSYLGSHILCAFNRIFKISS